MVVIQLLQWADAGGVLLKTEKPGVPILYV